MNFLEVLDALAAQKTLQEPSWAPFGRVPDVISELFLSVFEGPKKHVGRKSLLRAISDTDQDRFWSVSDVLSGSKIELPCRR